MFRDHSWYFTFGTDEFSGDAVTGSGFLSKRISISDVVGKRAFPVAQVLGHVKEVSEMNAHRFETVIRRDRTVLLKELPFQAGESVEVIISHCSSKHKIKDHYPLRGTSIKYVDPTEPVAGGDWNVSR